MTNPSGVVMTLSSPDGRVIAHAADFERGSPAGFSVREAQESRCKRQLSIEVVRVLASPLLSEAVDYYIADQIVARMRNNGCVVNTIFVEAVEGAANEHP